MNWLGSATLFVVLHVVICDFGAFVPNSFYIIDEDGNQSPVVLFRTRRSSGNSGSAYSSASASSSAGAGAGHFDAGYIPNFAHGDFSNLRYDFGPSNLPEGAKIFSRFGEEQGSGIHVSGNAQGPNGAFSSTSAEADDTGKVRYSVKSGKY